MARKIIDNNKVRKYKIKNDSVLIFDFITVFFKITANVKRLCAVATKYNKFYTLSEISKNAE